MTTTKQDPVYKCYNDGCDKSNWKGWSEPGRCPDCKEALGKAPRGWKATQDEPPLPPLDSGASSIIDSARNVRVERMDNLLTVGVPTTMSLDTAIHALQRQVEHENEVVEICEEVNCHPLDGARSLAKVLERRYGWVDATSYEVQTFFGKQEIKPTVISVEVDYKQFEQVLWGAIAIPGVDSPIRADAVNKGTPFKPQFQFAITGEIKRKYEPLVKAIADEVRVEVSLNSIYRGKAFRLVTDDDGQLNPMSQPKFMDLSRANPDQLILNEDVMADVTASIFTPIRHTEEVRRRGIPLKRGVLLYGDYGTGKTLTAFCTARIARDEGWTFVYLDRPEALPAALQFCSIYGPTVIFAEDIDRVVGVERDDTANNILNTIDGIESKGTDVMVILTSNHVDRIYPAMMRPGRLDHKIHIATPDKEAVAKLIRQYAGSNLPDNADITVACESLEGQIPAVVREAVDRSNLYSIARGEDLLSGEALALSARSMREEVALMDRHEPNVSPETKLGQAHADLLNASLAKTAKQVEEMREHF